MLTTIVLSLAIPGMVGVAWLALRGRLSVLTADTRGFALQTVLVMVVLLAIAGGVAAVLLSRGGEAITQLENSQVEIPKSDYNTEFTCSRMGGGTWNPATSTCS